jgi:hypothetical protein
MPPEAFPPFGAPAPFPTGLLILTLLAVAGAVILFLVRIAAVHHGL